MDDLPDGGLSDDQARSSPRCDLVRERVIDEVRQGAVSSGYEWIEGSQSPRGGRESERQQSLLFKTRIAEARRLYLLREGRDAEPRQTHRFSDHLPVHSRQSVDNGDRHDGDVAPAYGAVRPVDTAIPVLATETQWGSPSRAHLPWPDGHFQIVVCPPGDDCCRWHLSDTAHTRARALFLGARLRKSRKRVVRRFRSGVYPAQAFLTSTRYVSVNSRGQAWARQVEPAADLDYVEYASQELVLGWRVGGEPSPSSLDEIW